MSIHEKPFGMKVGEMIRPLIKLINQESAKHTETQLAIEQFGLLFMLACAKEELIQNEIAEKLHKDKSTILRTVKTLESKDLIRRVPDQYDRRKNYLMVTKKGERATIDHLTIVRKINEQILEGLTEEELSIFFKVIDHVKDNVTPLLD